MEPGEGPHFSGYCVDEGHGPMLLAYFSHANARVLICLASDASVCMRHYCCQVRQGLVTKAAMCPGVGPGFLNVGSAHHELMLNGVCVAGLRRLFQLKGSAECLPASSKVLGIAPCLRQCRTHSSQHWSTHMLHMQGPASPQYQEITIVTYYITSERLTNFQVNPHVSPALGSGPQS